MYTWEEYAGNQQNKKKKIKPQNIKQKKTKN